MQELDFGDRMQSGKQDARCQFTNNQKTIRVKEFYQDVFTQHYWQRFWPSLAEEWISSWRSVVAAGRKVGWWRIVGYLSCHSIVFICTMVLPLNFLLPWANQFTGGDDTCLPDGRFALGSYYSVWQGSGIFQITLGFGALSFSNAKLLDAIWDVVVGRGIQVLLALIAYKVTTKSLTMSMEHQTIPIGTFEAVALQDATGIAFYKQISNFLAIKNWRHQLRIFWIILSTLFIVAFPTLASAMTGYAPVTNPFLKGQDGQLIPFTSYRQVRYIIHDADRVGLASPLILSNVPPDDVALSLGPTRGDICTLEENMHFVVPVDGVSANDWNSVDERCRMVWHVRNYANQYGFLGLNDTISTFNQSGKIYDIPAPALNIEAAPYEFNPYFLTRGSYYQIRDEVMPERNWTDPRTGDRPWRYTDSPKYNLPNTPSVLTMEDVNLAGNCQQTATYKWGFSFLLLFLVLIFFMIWIIGTYILWIDAYLHSRLDIAKREMGLYRAVLDVSSVIQSDLDHDVDPMTPNNVLQKRLSAGKKVGRIGFQSLNVGLPLNTRMMDIQDWARKGGYSRWTPRLTLAILVHLLIILPIFLSYKESAPSNITAFIVIFLLLVILNIMVLGHERRRALSRKGLQSDISHHPLQSFDDGGQSPSASRRSTSLEATRSDRSDDMTNTHHVGPNQDSKTATSTTVTEFT